MPVASSDCERGMGVFHPSPGYPGYDLENLVFQLDEEPDAKDDGKSEKLLKVLSRASSMRSLTIRQSKSDSILLAYEHFYQGRQGSFETSLFSQQQHQEQHHHNSSGSVSFFCGGDFSCDSQGTCSLDSNMLTIEELKSYNKSCATCGVSWYDEHVSLDCSECGGYALERPCPQCEGQCLNVWRRDLERSHSTHKAQWEGTCSTHQQAQNPLLQGRKHSEPNLRISAAALHDKLAAPL